MQFSLLPQEELPVQEDDELEVQNYNGWNYVSDPHKYPKSTHVKIFMTFRKSTGGNSYYVCSGTLIDPLHVLTAGHCVYTHKAGFKKRAGLPKLLCHLDIKMV